MEKTRRQVYAQSNEKTADDGGKSRALAVISGVLVGLAITCIVIIAYALLITHASVTGDLIPAVVMVTCLVSVIVAGYDASKGAETRGWLWGVIAGLLYAVIFIGIGLLWVRRGFTLDLSTLTLIAVCVVGGGIGGALGINFRKKSRR